MRVIVNKSFIRKRDSNKSFESNSSVTVVKKVKQRKIIANEKKNQQSDFNDCAFDRLTILLFLYFLF